MKMQVILFLLQLLSDSALESVDPTLKPSQLPSSVMTKIPSFLPSSPIPWIDLATIQKHHCNGAGLIGVNPDVNINDGACGHTSSSLEVYCYLGVYRVCLTWQTCPWRVDGYVSKCGLTKYPTKWNNATTDCSPLGLRSNSLTGIPAVQEIFNSDGTKSNRYMFCTVNGTIVIQHTGKTYIVGITDFPSIEPSKSPSPKPSFFPSYRPTVEPSFKLTKHPSSWPSVRPSDRPLLVPTESPTGFPTSNPSYKPTLLPTIKPSYYPTIAPSRAPSCNPSVKPSLGPTHLPSLYPLSIPTPSYKPSLIPTKGPTQLPSKKSSTKPSTRSTFFPSSNPSLSPIMIPTVGPTVKPTFFPLFCPSLSPSKWPSLEPTESTSYPSYPSYSPTVDSTLANTNVPVISTTNSPTYLPSTLPSKYSSLLPAQSPTAFPSHYPSTLPSIPSTIKPLISTSINPTITPSCSPHGFPSFAPTETCSGRSSDMPLPLLTSSTTGSLFASSPVCTGSSCEGYLGQFSPATNSYINFTSVLHHYLNASNFSTTYYDFGQLSSTSASLSLGGIKVASLSSNLYSPAACTSLRLIVKTPLIYIDNFNIAVVYSASDSIGRLQCSYSSGSVKLTIDDGINVLYNGLCVETPNPVGRCTYSGSNSSLFRGKNYTVVVKMATITSTLTAVGAVFFHQSRIAISTYENLRGYIYLPQSPVYSGDTVKASIFVYSPSIITSVGTCAVDVNYNPAELTYVSNSAQSALFTPSELVNPTRGTVTLLFSQTASVTASTGVGLVAIGTFEFKVNQVRSFKISNITGQLAALGGVQGVLFCDSSVPNQPCSTQNPLYGHAFSGSNADIFFMDMLGAPGHTPGNIIIESPRVIGLYATSGRSTMVNEFPMTGMPSVDLLTVYATYDTSRTAWPDVQVPSSSLSCISLPDQPSNIATVYANTPSVGCIIKTLSEGSSAYKIQGTYSGFNVTATYRVYYPKNFIVVATRRIMRKLSSCPSYESSFIRVLASLYASSSHAVNNVDVTSLVSLNTSDHSIATLTFTSTLVAKQPGQFKLVAIANSSGIVFNNSEFNVSDCFGRIKSLYTFSYSTVTTSPLPALLESTPIAVTISISAPVMTKQTQFTSNVPQNDYAKLVTYAVDEFGTFMDVSQYSGLEIASIDSINVNVSKSGIGSNLFWYAYIPPNAVATSGNVLLPNLRDSCGTILTSNSNKRGYIFTTAGTPVKAQVEVTSSRLTMPNSCATMYPIDVPSTAQLTVTLYLESPESHFDMTKDSRTVYTYSSSQGVKISISSSGYLQVSPLSTIGTVNITVSFPSYRGASELSANVFVRLVDLKHGLRISTYDYPGHSVTPFSTLKQIECSGVYQRASLDAIATLTDGSMWTVTPGSTFSIPFGLFNLLTAADILYPGKGQAIVSTSSSHASVLVSATFCQARGNHTISSEGVASIISLSNLQYGPSSAQQPTGLGCAQSVYTVSTSPGIGCGATSTVGCNPSGLRIKFSDDTVIQYSDLVKIDLPPGKLLVFNSTDPHYVGINSSTGSILALQNSFQYATISVNSFCYTNHSTLPVSTSVSNVAANIYPTENDIKIGNFLGLPFVKCPISNIVKVPVYFQIPVGFYVGAWDIFLYYRNADLGYRFSNFYITGGTWSSDLSVSTLSSNNEVGSIHLYDSAYTSISTSILGNGALVSVADLSFQVLSSQPILTQLTADIAGLYYNPIGDNSINSQEYIVTSSSITRCYSCTGYLQFNNGVKPDNLPAPFRRSLMTSYYYGRQLDANPNILTGDVNGNGVCGSEDVQSVQALVNGKTNNYWKNAQPPVIANPPISLSEARSATLSMQYIKYCPKNYCNNGNYNISFVMEYEVVTDVSYMFYHYFYHLPILQFVNTGTPCDLIALLPTLEHPVMELQATLYFARLSDSIGGLPVECENVTDFSVEVYFEVNFIHTDITGLIHGGGFQQNNTKLSTSRDSTVIGPAVCKAGGIFSIAFSVSSLVPEDGYYAAAVGIDSSYGMPPVRNFITYYNMNFQKFSRTLFDPIYSSLQCPYRQTTAPTPVPPISVTYNPSVQPSVHYSDKPSAVPELHLTVVPTTINPSNLQSQNPSPKSIFHSTGSPSIIPSNGPSDYKLAKPSATFTPTILQSVEPSIEPIVPTFMPSTETTLSPIPHGLRLTLNDSIKIYGFTNSSWGGSSISYAGDVNGDGLADVIVGSEYSSNLSGAAYVIYGSPTLSDTNVSAMTSAEGFTIGGFMSGDDGGHVVHNAGDVNGDGYGDLILGAPGAAGAAGVAYIIFGGVTNSERKLLSVDYSYINIESITVSQGISISGFQPGSEGGCSVSYAGDVNGDGISDVIIGNLFSNYHEGAAYIIFGSKSLTNINISNLILSQGVTISGFPALSRGGYTVRYAGDINNDGISDVIIGGGGNVGIAYVIYGSKTLEDTMVTAITTDKGISISGFPGGGQGGIAANYAGDVNGDGIDDVIVSSCNSYGMSGAAYIIFGGKDIMNINIKNMSSTRGFSVLGFSSKSLGGRSVSSAGDLNEDGFADVLIGAPGAYLNIGAVYIIYGSRYPSDVDVNNMPSSAGIVITDFPIDGRAGYAVCNAGDVRGTGGSGILIGAPFSSSKTGEAFIVSPQYFTTKIPISSPTTITPSVSLIPIAVLASKAQQFDNINIIIIVASVVSCCLCTLLLIYRRKSKPKHEASFEHGGADGEFNGSNEGRYNLENSEPISWTKYLFPSRKIPIDDDDEDDDEDEEFGYDGYGNKVPIQGSNYCRKSEPITDIDKLSGANNMPRKFRNSDAKEADSDEDAGFDDGNYSRDGNVSGMNNKRSEKNSDQHASAGHTWTNFLFRQAPQTNGPEEESGLDYNTYGGDGRINGMNNRRRNKMQDTNAKHTSGGNDWIPFFLRRPPLRESDMEVSEDSKNNEGSLRYDVYDVYGGDGNVHSSTNSKHKKNMVYPMHDSSNSWMSLLFRKSPRGKSLEDDKSDVEEIDDGFGVYGGDSSINGTNNHHRTNSTKGSRRETDDENGEVSSLDYDVYGGEHVFGESNNSKLDRLKKRRSNREAYNGDSDLDYDVYGKEGNIDGATSGKLNRNKKDKSNREACDDNAGPYYDVYDEKGNVSGANKSKIKRGNKRGNRNATQGDDLSLGYDTYSGGSSFAGSNSIRTTKNKNRRDGTSGVNNWALPRPVQSALEEIGLISPQFVLYRKNKVDKDLAINDIYDSNKFDYHINPAYASNQEDVEGSGRLSEFAKELKVKDEISIQINSVLESMVSHGWVGTNKGDAEEDFGVSLSYEKFTHREGQAATTLNPYCLDSASNDQSGSSPSDPAGINHYREALAKWKQDITSHAEHGVDTLQREIPSQDICNNQNTSKCSNSLSVPGTELALTNPLMHEISCSPGKSEPFVLPSVGDTFNDHQHELELI